MGETWQMVSGTIEGAEKAYQCAQRELLEETGLRPLHFYQASYVNRFYLAASDEIVLSPVFAANRGVVALYAEDAFYLAPGDSIARGDVGRHFSWLSQFEAGKGPVVDFEIVDRTVRGDLATDIGYYRIRRAGEPEGSGSGGKFIVIWKRDPSGGWKIYADGYSEVRGPEGEGQ